MAHKGKQGPVAFRRDLNLNVNNNNDGWANRYLVQFLVLPPGIGNQLVGTHWDCGPFQLTPADTLFWQSGPAFHGIFVWDVRMEVFFPDNFSYTKRVTVREAISGEVLRLELINDPEPRSPEFPLFQTWKTIFRDPFFFTADGFSNSLNANRKLWDDGPPH